LINILKQANTSIKIQRLNSMFLISKNKTNSGIAFFSDSKFNI